ncbi:MAG: energy transducer TonB [bacterium]
MRYYSHTKNKALEVFFLFSIVFHLILLVFLGQIIHPPKAERRIEVDLKYLEPGRPGRNIPRPPGHLNDTHQLPTLKSKIHLMPEIIQRQKNIPGTEMQDYSISHKKTPEIRDSAPCEVTTAGSIIENINDISIPQLPMFLTRASSDLDQSDFYKAQILSHIKKHRKYPPAAQRLGIKGTVNVDFLLYRDGTLGNIKVTKKSRHQILNNAAIESIKAGEPYPPFPSGMQGKYILIGVPITFNLIEETTFN